MLVIKPGLHISRKDLKHLFANMFLSYIQTWIRLHIVAMITSIDISQEIFATDILEALKPSLKHHRKHVLRLLQLYGFYTFGINFPIKKFQKALEIGKRV